MRIIVLIKHVPDTWEDRVLDLQTGRLDRNASERVVDEISERAVEAALAIKDRDKDTEVVVLTMGPSEAAAAIKKTLSMGADSGIHVVDDALEGADAMLTATALAAAIRTAGADLVIAGNESTDGRGGMVPAMIAEHLGLPALTFISQLTVEGDSVRGERATETATSVVSAPLPAIVSITEGMPEARFPSFKGIMGAKKKPVQTLSLTDIAPDLAANRAAEAAARAAASVVLSVEKRPERTGGDPITDDGSAGTQLAEFLAQARLV
jgi:electron transfer flavoprotein beta subunit